MGGKDNAEPERSSRANLDTRIRGNRLAQMKITRRHSSLASAIPDRPFSLGLVLGFWLVASAGAFAGEERLILPAEVVADAEPAARAFDLVILGNEQIKRPLIGAAPEYVAKPQGDGAKFLVRGQQVVYNACSPFFY